MTFFAGMKVFPRIEIHPGKTKANSSGFERHLWGKRDSVKHKEDAERSKHAVNRADQRRLEANGCRWTDLYRLRYHDPIRHHTIGL